mmetsp:Transcript_14293/g.35554  ORF Transcript_14293/g.35554 Transcript_14293/m.35554 type:complete len:578 (+) Transcript_14293:516-2249(+)
MRQLGKKSVRAPLCEEYEVRQLKRDEWRIRVVMSRLPGEPLDSWIERARSSERFSPREGRFWRDFAESSRLAYRLMAQLSPTFEKVEEKALHRDVNSHNILISSCLLSSTSLASSSGNGPSRGSSSQTKGEEVQLTSAGGDPLAPGRSSSRSGEHQSTPTNSDVDVTTTAEEDAAGEGGTAVDPGVGGIENLGAAVGMDFWLIDFGLAVNAKEWRGRDFSGRGRDQAGRGTLFGSLSSHDNMYSAASLLPAGPHHDDGADGVWKIFDIGGDCKYWPPSSWKQFLYGWKYLQNSREDCRQYRTRLDHFALGITCLELLFHLCDRVEENAAGNKVGAGTSVGISVTHGSAAVRIVEGGDDMPSAELGKAILAVYDAWKLYWRDATRIWAALFATFKGTSGKDWQQLKQQFCRENVSQVSASNVARLKQSLYKCAAISQSSGHAWSYLSVLMSVLHDLVSESGRLSWRDVRVFLKTGKVPGGAVLSGSSTENAKPNASSAPYTTTQAGKVVAPQQKAAGTIGVAQQTSVRAASTSLVRGNSLMDCVRGGATTFADFSPARRVGYSSSHGGAKGVVAGYNY